MRLDARCRPIELILSDVDGVLTDGRLVYDNQGIETKQFHVRDGLGIKLWERSGFQFGIVTSRTSHIVKVRCAELGIELLRQGSQDKVMVTKEIIQSLELTPDQVCFIGDDLPDLPVIQLVGLGVAVADAVAEVRAAADYVTKSVGGAGAVRELVEMVLKAKDRWSDVLRKYE